MDNAIYTLISRQGGLIREFDAIANNVANADTTGFKKESGVFSEFIAALQSGSGQSAPSLSIGRLAGHATNFDPGVLRQTGAPLDVAIDGEGFFLVNVGGQTVLSRAGHFLINDVGTLIDANGNPVLNAAEGEIQIPPDVDKLSMSADGTLSANGVEFGRLGIVRTDLQSMSRMGGNYWRAPAGFEPVNVPNVRQGFLEDSNVNPVTEIARMIEVQRFYDAGQKMLDMENERIRDAVRAFRQMV